MDTILNSLTLPSTFRLPDVAAVTEVVFPFRSCPYAEEACANVRPWYEE